eukprot:SAG22_NODE_1087_length_5605_cov_7.128224_2_plen_564_part_00
MPRSDYSSSSRGSRAGSRRSYTQHPILADLENAPNPFTMPSDEEVFVLREEERNRKLVERKQQQRLRVHEKTTWASRQNAATVKELVGGVDSFDVPSDEEEEEDLTAPKVISRAPKDRSETMTDFIAKKREMFLVQMSLNTKREEISKLEQKAQARDIALKESETMLEMDSQRFEVFIRENDDKTMAAQEESRQAAKLRADADADIKKLRHEITLVEREIQTLEDKLAETTEARAFLAGCTPNEHFENERTKLGTERAHDRWLAEKKAAQDKEEADKAAAAAAREASGDPEPEPTSAFERAELMQKEDAVWKARREELVAEEVAAVKDEEIPMFFQKVQQLTDYFQRMEEDNLFMMMQCQESEMMFDDVKTQHDEKEATMTAECDELAATIAELRADIDVEQRRCNAIEARINQAAEDAKNDDSEQRLKEQKEAIKYVFELCYDPDDTLEAIEMLTRIEKKLEQTFAKLDLMTDDEQERLEKAKQKSRRGKTRVIQQRQQKEDQDRKIKKSLEQAMAPVKKKTGKPIMFRSPPPQRKEKVQEDNGEADQEALDLQYFGVSLAK